MWAAASAYWSFFRDVAGMELDEWDRLAAYEATVRNCGWWWPHTDFVMVCGRPRALHLRSGRLHRDGGLAVEYPDGWGVWSLNGVTVPQWLAETPAEALDPQGLVKIDNAQVRSEFVRKVGAERLIHQLGGKQIDRRGDYELLRLEFPFEPRVVMALKMLNPSVPELWHVEFVAPECDTIDKAMAFRNGTKARPNQLT